MLAAAPLFSAATVAVVIVGPRMARTADRLADVTGLGGAMFGFLFLALATDLPELTLTPAAVLSGTPDIAIGGLLGSAAAQLALLAVADIAFGRGRLYRHVPVLPIVGQSALMLAVLAVPLLAVAGTPTVGPVSVATFALPVAYLAALAAIRHIDAPGPDDDADDALDPSTGRADPTKEDLDVEVGTLWRRFGMYALVLASAGVALEWSTERIGSAIGLAETAAGALLAGVVTSLPELVTAIAAIRAGALDLATGDIIGSSALDVALLAYADAFYTDGTVFDLLDDTKVVLLGMAIALTTLLLIGLARRSLGESRRVAVESYVMLAVYGAGALVLITAEG